LPDPPEEPEHDRLEGPLVARTRQLDEALVGLGPEQG
jgi:hypothetical protein